MQRRCYLSSFIAAEVAFAADSSPVAARKVGTPRSVEDKDTASRPPDSFPARLDIPGRMTDTAYLVDNNPDRLAADRAPYSSGLAYTADSYWAPTAQIRRRAANSGPRLKSR